MDAAGSGKKGVPDVQVNMINQGVPAKAETQSVQFDGQRYVVNMVMKGIADNTGGIRDTLMSRR
jgi:hypothetical protein